MVNMIIDGKHVSAEENITIMEAAERNGIPIPKLCYLKGINEIAACRVGAVQGIPVCFDAKECNTDTFPLQNIHEHQVVFMENFEKQRGIAFFLISFTARDEFYYLRLSKLLEFWNRAKEGGRKSFRYEELEPEFFLPKSRGVLVPYLDTMQKDLAMRD